ncbi:MAG: septum formation initiator family protein, partial [FCB group bacterium]|nr:septum formation initiator family protein [FCB group bacterium]
LVIGDHGIYRLIKIRRERAAVQDRITALRAHQAELKLEANRLETDTEYIEKLAREKYRMARKGERVFKVIEKPKAR